MKKAIFNGVVILISIMSIVSCRKEYHCHCTYNNQLMASFDLGNKTKDDANKACVAHDSDMVGEVWTCTTY
jgi:hypothetical protein